MKNATSNIIDLDALLNKQEESKPEVLTENTVITETIQTPKPLPDIDSILSEWSWRCDKGYPTWGDANDMIKLQEVLSEMGITNLLFEARPHEHIDSKYIPNVSYSSKWNSVGISDLDSFIDYPLFATDDTQISKNDTVYLIKGDTIKKITGEEVNMSPELYTSWKSELYANTVFVVTKSKTNLIIQYKGAAATDTDVKEGLAFALFNSSVNKPFTKDTYSSNLKELYNDLDKSKKLGDVAYTRVKNYVTKLMASAPNVKVLSTLNETLSQALRLRDYSDFDIERDQIFKDIRDTASQISGYPADKWCPGDVYLIKKGSTDDIYSALQKALENTEIGYVNSLFIPDWGKKTSKADAVIVAVSLKLAKAQAGKAKAYLRRFTEDDKVFNVEPEELKLGYKGILEGIKRLRSEIKIILHGSKEVDFRYNPIMSDITDEDLARKKYASLKLIKYLLEREDDPAASLKGALQFGMSLSGINPTFYKLVGNRNGQKADVEEFEAGEHIAYYTDSHDKKPTIDVVDNNTSNSIIFKGSALLGDEILDFIFQSRSNGYAQATLEIQRLKPRKV